MLTNRSAPPVTETPVLVYPDVRAAVAWLATAFGFEERVRVGQAHRAQLRVGQDGAVIVADVHGNQVAPNSGSVTHVIKVRVSNVDAAYIRAREAGAGVIGEPTSYEYGERSCMLEDLAGHRWELTQTVRDVEPEEWGGVTVAPCDLRTTSPVRRQGLCTKVTVRRSHEAGTGNHCLCAGSLPHRASDRGAVRH